MKSKWVSVVACLALLLILAVAVTGTGQRVQTSSQILPSWAIVGGIAGSFYRMQDLNREIGYFNHDARVVAQTLDDWYAINMSVRGRVPDLNTGLNYYGTVLFSPFPALSVGIGIEFLQAETQGSVDISAKDIGVKFTVDVAAPTIGVYGAVVFDPTNFIDMGPWSIQAKSSFGYYYTEARSEKRIKLTGIEHFTLRDEVDVSIVEQAWGSKATLSVGYRLSPHSTVSCGITSRQLVFKNTGVNFNDLADTVDLDFGGIGIDLEIKLEF